MRETDLYPSVKAFLEGSGYTVMGEVRGCDVVAGRGGTVEVIVELKRGFTLDLLLQGVNRLSLCERVYLAVPSPTTPAQRRSWGARQRDAVKLCRRVGLGLMLVTTATGRVEVLAETGTYHPRTDKARQRRLADEFQRRRGDPTPGGVTGTPIMTAYRQDAAAIVHLLKAEGPLPVADIRRQTGIARAATIVQSNHYGWFQRVARGVYAVSDIGQTAALGAAVTGVSAPA